MNCFHPHSKGNNGQPKAANTALPKQNILNLKFPEAAVVGPFLRFGNYDPRTHAYTASVMILLHPSVKTDPGALRLPYGPIGGSKVEAFGIPLDTYKDWTFYRFNLELTLAAEPTDVEYLAPYAGVMGSSKAFSFRVPSALQPWRWMFYSCNGYDGDWKRKKLDGIQPLWRDFFDQHTKKPFHVQVGGGDQIYNDPIWEGNCPSLLKWRSQTREIMQTDAFSSIMEDEVADFYFLHYCHHFSEPIFKDALATVPYIYTWDDHDIFDGWGSYPEYLQKCPVFQGIYAQARRFYLLFQQHATEASIRELNHTFGKLGFSEIKLLGNHVALWVLDNRSERTRERIAAPDTYAEAKLRLYELPSTVRHVVTITTVPIVFPKLPLVEDAMSNISGKKKRGVLWTLLNKSGVSGKLLSAFDEPDLLDDMMDHWTAAIHMHEKKQMILLMQDLARERQVRVTFISGDVHLQAVGRLYSYPKQQGEDFREDFRFMANITSSAMGNEAPPDKLLRAYELFNASNDLNLGPTREKMVKRFKRGRKKFHNRRNYCTIDEYPYDPNADNLDNGALNFTLRAENTKHKDRLQVDHWENMIPILTSTEDKWIS
jgi:phosphodiesterase/alkaline phosphatase D-like protein